MNKRALAKNIAVFAITAIFAIVLGSQLPALIKLWRGPFVEGDFNTHVTSQKHKLTLYGTTTCKYCISARTYLKEAGTPFNDLVIDESAAAKTAFKELNQPGVPVLVSADKLVVGFDQDAYARLDKLVNGK